MTNEELVIKIKAGETNLIEELWQQTFKFVYKQANQFYFKYIDRCKALGIDLADLEQEGYLAIYETIKAFDPDRGTTFLTFAGYYLQKKFFGLAKMNYLNWQNNMARWCESLDAPAYSDNESVSLADTIMAEDSVDETVIDKLFIEQAGQDLAKAVSKLTENQQKIIFAIYYQELRSIDIARERGIARTNISRSHKKALEALSADPVLAPYKNK